MASHFESARRCKLLARLTDDELSAFMRFADFKGIRQFLRSAKRANGATAYLSC